MKDIKELIAPTTDAATSDEIDLRLYAGKPVAHRQGIFPITLKATGATSTQAALLQTTETVTAEYWDGYQWWPMNESGDSGVVLDANNNVKVVYAPTKFRVKKSTTALPVGVARD